MGTSRHAVRPAGYNVSAFFHDHSSALEGPLQEDPPFALFFSIFSTPQTQESPEFLFFMTHVDALWEEEAPAQLFKHFKAF